MLGLPAVAFPGGPLPYYNYSDDVAGGEVSIETSGDCPSPALIGHPFASKEEDTCGLPGRMRSHGIGRLRPE